MPHSDSDFAVIIGWGSLEYYVYSPQISSISFLWLYL